MTRRVKSQTNKSWACHRFSVVLSAGGNANTWGDLMSGVWVKTIVVLGCLGQTLVAQGPILPPIPDGPRLDMELLLSGGQAPPDKLPELPPAPGEVAAPKVLTETVNPLPPVNDSALFNAPWHPDPPPATYSTSGCHFNPWCGDELFSPDFSTVQMLAGGYWSSKSIGPKVPRFDMASFTLRTGTMLNAPQDTDAFWRGNLEVLCDLTASYVNGSFGNYALGPALIGRYNFVPQNASLIPYLQVGAGFIYSDAYKDRNQTAIGSEFNTRLFAGVGVHCLLRENLFLDVEGGYQAISNLGLTARGDGVHSLGVQIGLTYFFRSGGR